jgi:regulator of sirC expression with transglutaminase-like and TPR domain
VSEPWDILLFAHLVRRPDADIDLERAALLIAEAEYAALDVSSYVAKLDALGQLARQRLRSIGRVAGSAGVAPADSLLPLLDLMYRELGFRGNALDYYDPANSFLNKVIDRRVGIPITLAIVLLAICRRAGVKAQGVSFPGHFLVRSSRNDGEPVFVDPFDGSLLVRGQIEALYEQATGEPGGAMDECCLAPASRRQILARVLNNLRAIHEVRGDCRRLREILERLAVVNPSEEVRSRLDLLVRNVPIVARVSIN